MKCLQCNTPMHEEPVFGIVLDRCPDCHGVWFDYDEVNQYLRSHPGAADRGIDVDVECLLLKMSEELDEECPKCRRNSIEAGEAQGIHYRRCSTFCGFFLESEDFGKLTALRLPSQPVGSTLSAAGHAIEKTAGEAIGEGLLLGFWYVVLSILTP